MQENGVAAQVAEVGVLGWNLPGSFTYLCPPGPSAAAAPPHPPVPGSRVLVPFGRREALGIVLRGAGGGGDPPRDTALREMQPCVDRDPVLDTGSLRLAEFAARYYRLPWGKLLEWSIPAQLRKPGADGRLQPFSLAEDGGSPQPQGSPQLPEMTAEQRRGAEQLAQLPQGFAQVLVEGVTGSGKTLLYAQKIAEALASGGQVLFLVPEIAFTYSMAQRLGHYFGLDVPVLHSGARDTKARYRTWLAARQGRLPILVGTRSAVFTPMPRLKLLVVDEEHDSSYFQDSAHSYSGRDLAIMRAQQQGIPVLLGSATPSLDSLHRVRRKRCSHLELRGRPLAAAPPKIELVDRSRTPPEQQLSEESCRGVERALGEGDQAMVFLDLRGYARSLACPQCDWVQLCRHCELPTVWHRSRGCMLCHRCGSRAAALEDGRARHRLQPGAEPPPCPRCGGGLAAGAPGTEAVAEWCAARFPGSPVLRLDRDMGDSPRRLQAILREFDETAPAVLVGTRMLAKGHHLPRLRVVAVPNANLGLWHPDFRAAERWAQLLVQAAGRAGREGPRGTVYLETSSPKEPLLGMARRADYRSMAEFLLAQRRACSLPPYSRLVAVRSEATTPEFAERPLLEVRRQMAAAEGVQVVGPMPGMPERIRSHYRAVLHLTAADRRRLHPWLPQVEAWMRGQGRRGRLRWRIAVDPAESL